MTNEFIEEYSNYIYGLTKYFEGYKNKEDLFQVGCIGLMMAYQRFDATMGVKFTTYAYPYILGEMKKLVRQDKGIKISKNVTRLKYQIEKTIVLLSQKLMRQPTTLEIAQFLEVDESDIIECLETIQTLKSIDEAIVSDGKEVTLHDMVGDHQLDLDTLVALKEELQNLNKEEKILLEGSFIQDMTQEEISNVLGISQVQVSRKLHKIKQKIRERLVA